MKLPNMNKSYYTHMETVAMLPQKSKKLTILIQQVEHHLEFHHGTNKVIMIQKKKCKQNQENKFSMISWLLLESDTEFNNQLSLYHEEN